MKHIASEERIPQMISIEGAEGVSKASLLTAAEGAPTVAMRLFELKAGGHTPWHTHDWEHIVYVLEGSGLLKTENGNAGFRTGDSLLVDPNEMHNFTNTGDGRLRFLCIVPLKGD
jgi:quercetin dioxygenase-like cupin family protein